MSDRRWFICTQGEIIGPLLTEAVQDLLKEKRLDPTEYLWSDHLLRWVRACEIPEFQAGLPPYPKVSIPKDAQFESVIPFDDSEPDPKDEEEKKKLRKHPRVKVSGLIISKDFGSFEILDISQGGVFLKSNKIIPLGTTLDFAVQFQGINDLFQERVSGIVIRKEMSKARFGFAIEFMSISKELKDKIAEYVVSGQSPCSLPAEEKK